MKTKDLQQLLETNSIWKPASVTQEPSTKLTQWRVMKVAGDFNHKVPTIHLVGYTGFSGRVSSEVVEFDMSTMRGITASGRAYELCGNSGFNGDAMYVWDHWMHIAHNPEVEDITEQYN